MNGLRRYLMGNRMLCGLVCSFALLLMLSYAISLFFYYQQAENFELERRSFMLGAVRSEAGCISAVISAMQAETDVLGSAPGLDAFFRNSEARKELTSFLEVYLRPRHALETAAYYHVKRRILCGFSDRPVFCVGPTAPCEELKLSDTAFQALLDEGGFALSVDEGAKRLIECYRVSDDIVCFRIFSASVFSRLLNSANSKPLAFEGSVVSLIVKDRFGQELCLGRALGDVAVDIPGFPASAGIRLTAVMPELTGKIIWSHAEDTVFYYGVALMISGGMLICILSARLHRPVKSALEAIPNGERENQENSELERIRSSILRLTSALTADEETLRRQDALLRRSLLCQLFLNGISDASRTDALLERCSLSSCFEKFSVFYLLEDGRSAVGAESEARDVPSRIFGINLRCVSRRSDGLVLLASASGEHDDFQAAGEELLRCVEDSNASLCLIRSGVHCGVSEASTAYWEAVVAAEESARLKKTKSGVYYYLELQRKKSDDAASASLEPLEQRMCLAALDSDADVAEGLFSQYCVLLSESPYSFRLQKIQIAAMFLRLLTQPAVELRLPIAAAEAELLALLSPELSHETFECGLKALYQKICSSDTKRGTTAANRFESILSYVHHHIYEETLSAAEVADHFGISLSSLSREFQKHTGSGFSSYLHTKRIATAKNLLRKSSKSVKEIAREAGYANSLSFTRAFRKYEGVTPGAYRTANEKESPGRKSG